MTRADAIGAVAGFVVLLVGVVLVTSPGWACIVAGILLLAFALAPRPRPKGEAR